MTIRAATENDVPAIVELLKLSLGENLLPKSEAFWNWKHNQNPFGKSPVLLMEDAAKLVGVRAFMPWIWTKDGMHFKAIRAVDTATHPEYQGKGIFKKLTLQLVNESKKNDFDFIFNTPNESSMPGYLKMGWTTAGKLGLRIRPSIPVIFNLIGLSKSPHDERALETYDAKKIVMYSEALKRLIDINRMQRTSFLETEMSIEHLIWRYVSIPIHRYYCLHDLEDKQSFCLFFRPKQTKFGMEGRITDMLIDFDKFSVKEFINKVKNPFEKFDFMSIVGGNQKVNPVLNKLLFLPNLNIGPTVTTRNLNLENSQILLNFALWKPTLGDLELF